MPGHHSDRVESATSGSMQALELNLLHVAWSLRFQPLGLNIDGSPNRRWLLRIARELTLPVGQLDAEARELSAEQADYLGFLLALSVELGIVSVGNSLVVGVTDNGFFTVGPELRARKIADALTRLRSWSELTIRGELANGSADSHFSFGATTGERLIGPRGAVFTAVRREAPVDWTPVSEVQRWCQSDGYIDRAVGGDARRFLTSLAMRTLFWSGVVDTGTDGGKPVFRLTTRGRVALGIDSVPQPEATHRGLVVQPNLEITAMLDATPIQALHELYRVAQRRSYADRVATFALSAKTVQRGYAAGATAQGIMDLFEQRGVTPVPQSVEFQLRDWERVHRRTTIYADGILFRHQDPDALDLVIGQLQHENPAVEFVRLGPSTTFAAAHDMQGLARLFKSSPVSAALGLDVDIAGFPPPALRFTSRKTSTAGATAELDPLSFVVDPVACDIVTAFEIERIAHQVARTAAEQTWTLDPDLVRARWPDRPFERAIAFLEPRADGGLPAVGVLQLRALLESAPQCTVQRGVTVLTIDLADAARRLADAPEFAPYVVRRLGERTFAIDPAREAELVAMLAGLGVEVVNE